MNRSTQKGMTAWLRHLIPRDRIWRVVDAEGQILGRLAVQIGIILRGGHKPYFLDNMNCGDPVIVLNADKFKLTGRKSENKLYIRHTGYPGGLRKVPITEVLRRRPAHPLRRAIYNMLPRNKLRAVWMNNLHVYMGDEHPHESQSPVPFTPAQLNMRLRGGGPPSPSEFDTWWTDNLLAVSDADLSRIVTNVRAAHPEADAASGLAQILSTSTNDPKLNQYIAAAERSLREDPIFIPQSKPS